MSHEEYIPIRVHETRVEIDGFAKTVVFDVPPEYVDVFQWRAGQHLGVRLRINGEEARRLYSISSSFEAGEPLRITVKRVREGLVSNHINDHVCAGDVLDLAPPSGSFVLDPLPHGYRTCYFYGAGSGITPLYAMIRTLLEREPQSSATLIYGNRKSSTVLLSREFEALRAHHPKRFQLAHVFSEWGATWFASAWRSGIIDAKCVADSLDVFAPYAQDTQYFVCGPGSMNQDICAALKSRDVPAHRIHSESYGTHSTPDADPEGVDATLVARVGGQEHTIPIVAGQTVLDALRKADVPVPFSCQSGVCGTCRARLTGGDVQMRANMALDEGEVASGEILTCQSLPITAEVTVNFDL